MAKIDQIVNDIYDPKIEDPQFQTFMRACIKSWLHDAINQGIALGRADIAIELEATIKKAMNPGASVVIIGRGL